MHRLLRVAILITFFLILFDISAKNKPEPGYVITVNNDTIEGYVNCYTWLKDNSEISFFNNEGGTEIIYSPKNIKAFGTQNEMYRRAVIAVDQHTLAGLNGVNSSSLNLFSDTVFLKVLVDGKKQLLVLNDSTGRENFFIYNNSVYTWLTHYTYAIVNNGKVKKINNNNYIGQLLMYLDGCRKINELLSKTRYTSPDLVKVFEEYNDCIGLNITYSYVDKNIKYDLGVSIGATMTKLWFDNTTPDWISEPDYPRSTNVTGGFSVNVFLPGKINFWSVYNEVTYSSFKTNASYNNIIDANNNSVYDINIAAHYLNINNMLRANISGLNVGVFFNIGISNGITIAKTNKLTGTVVSEGVSKDVDKTAVDGFKVYQPRLLVGGGVNFRKILFEVRYMYGSSISSIDKSSTNTILLLLNYKL